MKRGLRLALLLSTTALAGCTLPPASSTGGTNPTGSWQNWQIQAGTAITSPPNTYPSFLGAMQIQGSQASGVFTTVYAPGSPTPSSTVNGYTGSFASATGNITLATYGYSFNLTQPATPYTSVPVGVIGGCVYPPGYTGAECLAIFASPSVGFQIAPLNGTYTGTLTESNSPTLSGTATLILTQSSAPNSSGQFPLSGTITFPAGSGFGMAPLGGTVSGEGITLSDSSAAPNSPTVNVTASTSSDASQITLSNLLYSNFGPAAVFNFTGTLTRQ
jgi:hypothetical protein